VQSKRAAGHLSAGESAAGHLDVNDRDAGDLNAVETCCLPRGGVPRLLNGDTVQAMAALNTLSHL
jgi:hypothetical protein